MAADSASIDAGRLALSDDLLSAALDYAARGFPVFPCDPGTKRPLTEAGFKDASTDAGLIRAWWAAHPDAMIGMPTGDVIGAWVLDVDDPALFEAACPVALPDTRRCVTGKGYHLWFAADPASEVRNAQVRMAGGEKRWPFDDMPGAEVRGNGGYVIVPPSVHPSGRRYAWVRDIDPAVPPAELLRIVRKQAPAVAAPARITATGADTPYGLSALDEECGAVRAAGNGAQEGTLNAAALRIGGLVAGGALSAATARAALVAAGSAMPSHNPRDVWTPQAVLRKVERGLADGAAHPRGVPERVPFAPPRREPPRREDGGATHRSEDSVALAFTARYGASLRYDRDRGRWYEWDGWRWQPDELQRAFHYARQIAREEGHGDRHLSKAAAARGIEAFARADPVHAVTSATWDADPLLLGTPGGTVDLRSGKLRPADPGDFITRLTAVAPEPGEPVRWLQFLREALGDDAELIEFVQRWCGYCLTGLTSAHALVFVYGPGGNGKSVFLNTLSRILADYAAVAAMDTFTASRGERHSTELAMLQGARLVTGSETEEGKRWADARIKALTGGDPLTARFMRQDNFTFTPQFKLMIAGNHMPLLASVDDAMRRRLYLVPFVSTPARVDEQLEEKLRAEHGRILQWAIEGCLLWQQDGLPRPAAVRAATDSYFEDQDLFGQWIAERCEVEAGAWEQPARLYQSWSAFAKEAGDEPGGLKSLRPRLERRGFCWSRTNGLRIYRGLRLRNPYLLSHSDGSDG